MSFEYKYYKYKNKYKNKYLKNNIIGGKCSFSSLDNLKIIKGHGKLYYDPFIISKDIYVITLFEIGYNTPMNPRLELEVLDIFKKNKEVNFFDFSHIESTEREQLFENIFIKGIKFKINKYREGDKINNQIIIFDNELCGIYCSNNTFSKCVPIIYGKKIFSKLTNKHSIYRNSIVEQINIEKKYITINFELEINIEKIFINCDIDELDLMKINIFPPEDENEKNKLIYFKKINRIKIILYYAKQHNFFIKTLNLKNQKYNDKHCSFIFDENKIDKLIERFPIKINNETVLIKGENLYLFWNDFQPISIKNIMDLDINNFLNNFALNVPININDIDDTKYIENKYKKYKYIPPIIL